MQAIILAAGMGKRLKELTQNNTKCMVKVNGEMIIDRLIYQLKRVGVSRIIIVTGYKKQSLVRHIEALDIEIPIIYINNSIYNKTNNIYSLSLAKKYIIEEDTLLFESDIIFEDSVLDALINDPRENLALVDKYKPWMDGTCLKLDENDKIIDFVSSKTFDYSNLKDCFKTVNIYKFSKSFSKKQYIPFLEAYLKAFGANEYYEQVLRVITVLDNAEIEGKRLNGEKWYEIDDIQDLDIAETIFEENSDERLLRIEKRYGGYWRFPEVLDFCYLVNPYYPTQRMRDEIKASFDKLLENYPSGMEVNSLLASKNFNVKRECIVVGNGASELIKVLLEQISGKIGIIKPTFEEYPNRCKNNEIVVFEPERHSFKYNAEDIIRYFDGKNVDSIVLINPDNPPGNYINAEGVYKLIEWTKVSHISLM